MTRASAADAASDTNAVLRSIGGYERDVADRWRYRPSTVGVTFARGAPDTVGVILLDVACVAG